MLYDAYGRKVETGRLTGEDARPSLTGVRALWTDSVASGLTPGRLAGLLQAAVDGDPHEYLTLAEEMEEREWHYASVLGTRKRSVGGLPVTVEAASDAAADVALADEVRALVRDPAFGDLVDDLMDALGKGYSAVEIVWDKSARQWRPGRYEHRDPRFFRFDRATGRELRLLDAGVSAEGAALAPYKWLVHRPRLKTGLPVRGGLARPAAWSYLFKNYTVKDWMAFVETFGMPVRVGKYGPSATPAQIEVLLTALANLGSDAAAAIPESMQIEFVEAQKYGSVNVYDTFAKWMDQQVSKVVLGQTMTSDDGSSLSQAQVHNDVRLDIVQADARQVSNTLNRDLVRPFVDLNHGPQAAYPRVVVAYDEPEDTAALVDALAKLVPLGLRVEASGVRDRLGLPDPAAGAGVELLGPAPAPALNRARNRAEAGGLVASPAEQLADQLAGAGQPAVDAWIGQLAALVERAESLAELKALLLAAYGDLPTGALGQVLAAGLTAAAAAGRFDGAADA